MHYKYLKRPNHPNANKNGRIKKSRFVMSEFLGRPLEKTEIVHHINGDKADDRIENLIILTKMDHTSYHTKIIAKKRVVIYSTKTCPHCKKEFTGSIKHTNFKRDVCCSASCRKEYYKKERGANTKINQEIADKIRALKGILSSRKTALAFNISPTHVKTIWRNEVW